MAVGQMLSVVRAPLQVPKCKHHILPQPQQRQWLVPLSHRGRGVLLETDKKILPARKSKELEPRFQGLGGPNPVPDLLLAD